MKLKFRKGLASLSGRKQGERFPFTDVIEMFLQWLEPRIKEYHTLLTRNTIFIKRTAGEGVLTPEMAVSYGCTGPVLRGSGVDFDLRRDGEPIYTRMYKGYDFDVISAPFEDAPREVISATTGVGFMSA
jgi:NADH-quinone oxidoreductase subunit D